MITENLKRVAGSDNYDVTKLAAMAVQQKVAEAAAEKGLSVKDYAATHDIKSGQQIKTLDGVTVSATRKKNKSFPAWLMYAGIGFVCLTVLILIFRKK